MGCLCLSFLFCLPFHVWQTEAQAFWLACSLCYMWSIIILLYCAISVLQVINSSSLNNFRHISFIFVFVIAISSSFLSVSLFIDAVSNASSCAADEKEEMSNW